MKIETKQNPRKLHTFIFLSNHGDFSLVMFCFVLMGLLGIVCDEQ